MCAVGGLCVTVRGCGCARARARGCACVRLRVRAGVRACACVRVRACVSIACASTFLRARNAHGRIVHKACAGVEREMGKEEMEWVGWDGVDGRRC